MVRFVRGASPSRHRAGGRPGCDAGVGDAAAAAARPRTGRRTCSLVSATSTPVIPAPGTAGGRPATPTTCRATTSGPRRRRQPGLPCQVPPQQVAVEVAEFRQTARRVGGRAEPPPRQLCTSPPAKVGDPFRSPEEWAAAGTGPAPQVLVHQPRRREAPRPALRADRARPGATRRHLHARAAVLQRGELLVRRRVWPRPATWC